MKRCVMPSRRRAASRVSYAHLVKNRHRRVTDACGALWSAWTSIPQDVTGQAWRKGSHDRVVPAKPLVELLVAGHTFQSRHLKRRLIQEGIKEHQCEQCGLSEWQDEPIPLEIDHIDGRRNDNRLENIRRLCPNCHALAPACRGRNIGRYASEASAPYHLYERGRSQIRHRREA